MRTETNYIVVHCSANPITDDWGADEIDALHKSFGWAGIGYHFVIRRSGALELGRAENAKGAHVKGHNWESIGICMIGGVDANNDPEDNFTDEQYATLTDLLRRLSTAYPDAKILGHRDFAGVTKACPCFDVATWLVTVGF